MGARFISHGSDVRFLRAALRSVLDDFGGLFA